MNNPQYCIIVDGSCDLIQAVSNYFLSVWFCRPGLVSLGSTAACIKLPTLQRR